MRKTNLKIQMLAGNSLKIRVGAASEISLTLVFAMTKVGQSLQKGPQLLKALIITYMYNIHQIQRHKIHH